MRTFSLLLCFLLLGGMRVEAQSEPADPLTPRMISEGWIRLFDGETTFGWVVRGDAEWTVKEGMVEATGGKVGFLTTTTEFGDFEVRAECWLDEKANSGLFLRVPVEGEITQENSYEVNVYDPHPKWPTGSINNVQRTKVKIPSVGRWTSIVARAEGDQLTVTMNGKQTVKARDSKHSRGVIGLQSVGGGTVRFRNVLLRPLRSKNLLTGKDLSGWKPLPNHRSKYSLTPEGWLNIKDGNGEIQTESQWGDFVLQIEVYSNGDHLNSGIFFREDPGAFWGGYECQIRNQWQGEDRTKPVDFGTGGLYFYHPTRKVVSSDREWFTMTVVAHGLHYATWVNGYQTADFTDKRKPTEGSARGGARSKPGVIGLQGHDPTTDLTFRNIHIAELPALK